MTNDYHSFYSLAAGDRILVATYSSISRLGARICQLLQRQKSVLPTQYLAGIGKIQEFHRTGPAGNLTRDVGCGQYALNPGFTWGNAAKYGSR